MTVAVEKCLVTLRTYLKERGYDVVVLEDFNYPVDAAIYSSNKMPSSVYRYEHHGMLNSSSYAGVLMINAKHKSFDEIEYILKKRVYSPLF